MRPRCSSCVMSMATEPRKSPECSTRRRVPLRSHCFEHAAVSGNRFVIFWEVADMDINRKDSNKMIEAAIDAVRTADPDRTEMAERTARVWARIGTEFGESERSLKPSEVRSD